SAVDHSSKGGCRQVDGEIHKALQKRKRPAKFPLPAFECLV
ncbi:MAG: hypothetical protein ACI932_002576, partial [Paracoccaceae bacterium]